LGRSSIVGLPLFHLLNRRNATVTLCHSLTQDISTHTWDADIVVSAVGKAGLLKANMVRPGAIIVDVGINEDKEKGIVGDADYEELCKVASAVTPVPGGVGPMTIAILVENLWKAYQMQLHSLPQTPVY
jgi:methylenetetrahydrofolate dehydrogenase (NADP+)/methenyltetrahydrofolate cyclohydrolase